MDRHRLVVTKRPTRVTEWVFFCLSLTRVYSGGGCFSYGFSSYGSNVGAPSLLLFPMALVCVRAYTPQGYYVMLALRECYWRLSLYPMALFQLEYWHWHWLAIWFIQLPLCYALMSLACEEITIPFESSMILKLVSSE